MNKRTTEQLEDEQGEDYIDLEDISIYDNDPNYEPTEEEVIYYAERLGFDVENDPSEFLSIAYQALKAPLPENWRRALIKSKDELVYINLEDQTIHLYTEIDEMAYKYYVEEKEKWLKTKQDKESRPKVVPRAKIPPLKPEKGNEKKKGKKQKLENIQSSSINNMNNNNNSSVASNNTLTTNWKNEAKTKSDLKQSSIHKKQIIPEEMQKKKSTKSPNTNLSPHKGDLGVNENSNKIDDIYSFSSKFEKHKKKDNHKTLESEKEYEYIASHDNSRISNHNYQDDDLSQNLINSIKEDKRYHSPEKTSTKEKILKLEKSSDKKTPIKSNKKINLLEKSPESKHSESLNDEMNLELMKNEYFNSKMNEMKEFETRIRESYNKSSEEYKNIKNQLKLKYSEDYEKQIMLTKRKIKDENDLNLKASLKDLEEKMETIYEEKISEFISELQKNKQNENNCDNESLNLKLSELENEKKTLTEQINYIIELKNQRLKNILQSELQEAKSILEEKFEIDKKNLTRKFELLTREFEIKQEEKFNKELEDLRKQNEITFELQEKTIKQSNTKLLEDYQQALEEEFNTQCKIIQFEVEDNHKKDINLVIAQIEKEKEEKSKLFKKEISELEKEYYIQLNQLREENKVEITLNDSKVSLSFENVVKSYDNLKKMTQIKTENVITELFQKIRRILDTQEIESEKLYSAENNIEEHLLGIFDEYLLSVQRKKSAYDTTETEYKDKSLFLEYYIDVLTHFLKFIKENPIKSIEKESGKVLSNSSVEEKIYQNLVNFTREKQKELKGKNDSLKETKQFKLLENSNLLLHPIHSTKNIIFQDNIGSSTLNINKNTKNDSSNNLKIEFNSNSLLFSNELNKTKTLNQYNLNKSIVMKPETKIPLSDRYNNSSITEKKEENENSSSPNRGGIPLPTSSSYKEKTYTDSLSLSSAVIQKLDQNAKNLVSLINDFIMMESSRLTQDLQNLTNHRRIFENLRNSIEGIDEKNGMTMQSNTVMNYIQIIEDDREKIKIEERKFNYQKGIYDKIYSQIEDCFIYIRNNINFDTNKETISEKLVYLKSQIDDYYEAYSEIKKNRMGFESKSIAMNGNGKNILSYNTIDVNSNSTKIGNSTDFFISQKMNQSNYNSNENLNKTVNYYDTLYRKSLNDDIYTPTTTGNSFIKYKKTKYELDSKVDLIRMRLNNSSSIIYD